jgi:hypothetical protein
VVTDDATVKAFIAERAGIGTTPDNVFRVGKEE